MSDNKLKIENFRKNINSLEGEMRSLNEQLDLNPEDLLASNDLLDSIQDIQIFDYDKEIQCIKEDSYETLDCLSKLYLSAEDINIKNLNNIIKNDAENLSDLKFTISCNKRAIVSIMKNLDLGINDPLMYSGLGAVQKELRETIKLSYELQKKMLTFYKDIRDELSQIKTIQINEEEEYQKYEEINDEDESTLHIVDYDKLTQELDDLRKNKE